MKKFYLLLLGLMAVSSMSAKQIDVNSAQRVAAIFLKGGSTLRSGSDISLKPVHTEKENTMLRSSGSQNAYYHVFNVGDNNGFIIISADDVNVPIIGYSDQGSYEPGNLSPAFSWWMGSVKEATKAGIEAKAEASEETIRQWSDYLSGKTPVQTRAATSVAPLIKTKWDQGAPYNSKIPFKVANGTKAPYTGCVGTATVQVMKYHNHPRSGIGTTPTYQTNGIQVPSVNLGQFTYDWANMTNTYSIYSSQRQRDAVGLLMWHVGAAIKTDYMDNGSGSDFSRVSAALKNYFGYDQGVTQKLKVGMSNSDWKNLIKEELTAKRPILYAGSKDFSGHAFVCDGYDSSGNFHMNWGWGGNGDGYFNIDALIVNNMDFSQGHDILYNIKPKGIIAGCNIPSNLQTSNITATEATLHWDNVPGAYNYELQVWMSGNWQTFTINPNVAAKFATLKPGSTYHWKVKANCSSGGSDFTELVTFTTLTGCNVPSNLQTSNISATEATLHWDNIPEAYNYELQVWMSGNWQTFTINPNVAAKFATLKPGTTYHWKVKANCSSGGSDFTELVTFTTLAGCNVPSNLQTSNITATEATLHWDNIPEAYNYELQVWMSGNWQTFTINPNVAVKLTGLKPGTNHYWTVKANCSSGGSDYSQWVSFTTPWSYSWNTTGIDSDTSIDSIVSIYPNPVEDVLNIKSDAVINKVTMYDLSGKAVLIDSKAESMKAISVSHLPKGIYILKVETENGVTTEKVTVK